MNNLSIAGNHHQYILSPQKRNRDTLTALFFLIPTLVFFFIFIIYPIIQSLYYSFFNWKGFGPAVNFVGFRNYEKILTDSVFAKAVANGLLIVVLSLIIQLPISIALAIMVRNDMPGRSFFRTIFFMPFVFSESIAGIIWVSMFKPDPSIGFLNAIWTLIPGVKPLEFLGDTNQVMMCVFIALTWKYLGFHMLLYMAGLANIPREIEEAAIIDGANNWQIIRNVTLPLLGTTIRTSVYLSVLGSLQQFGLIWIMSKGGPVNASETMAIYMYRFGFIRLALGYGCAVVVILLLICLIFSVSYQRLVKQQDYLGGLYS